jgi:uncharacterized protein YjbI with pentapeptide repeats
LFVVEIDMTGEEIKTEKLTERYAQVVTRGGAVDLNAAGMDGSDEDLSRVEFYGANLQGANLSGATLNGRFRFANLRYANLSRTKRGGFDDCDFTGANLAGADLTNSELAGNLTSAILRYADLRGCNLSSAKNLNQADLRGAKYTERYQEFSYQATRWPYGFNPEVAGAICDDC